MVGFRIQQKKNSTLSMSLNLIKILKVSFSGLVDRGFERKVFSLNILGRSNFFNNLLTIGFL